MKAGIQKTKSSMEANGKRGMQGKTRSAAFVPYAFCILRFAFCISVRADTHYVDAARPDDAGNGMSWATAKQTIQAAVDIAVSNDVVLVTNGIYAIGGRIAASMTNRVAITNGVIVRAGSANPELTIISGLPDPVSTNGPSAIRGVYVGTGSQLIGFTVTNGYSALASGPARYGGGIYADKHSVVSNCVVTLNTSAYDGGGVWLGSNSVISSCLITSNSAASGGGVYAYRNSIISGCQIISNTNGGGVVGEYGSIVVESVISFNKTVGIWTQGDVYSCTVSANTGGSTGVGAGIAAAANSVISNCSSLGNVGVSFAAGGGSGGKWYHCDIITNSAGDSGGLGTPTLVQDCLIQGNRSRYGGAGCGGVWVRCRIIANTNQGDSGAVDNGITGISPVLTNCLVAYNVGTAYSFRGAGVADAIAVNCTIVSNSNYGANNMISMTNCIVYGNAVGDFVAGTYSNIGYTCARTNIGSFPDAVNLITNNPLFVDSTNGDYRLRKGSPCFNSGINQDWMANDLDLDGNPRICNYVVDMGAYEYTRPRGTVITILGAPAP